MNLSSTSHGDDYTPDYMLSYRRHSVVEIMLDIWSHMVDISSS